MFVAIGNTLFQVRIITLWKQTHFFSIKEYSSLFDFQNEENSAYEYKYDAKSSLILDGHANQTIHISGYVIFKQDSKHSTYFMFLRNANISVFEKDEVNFIKQIKNIPSGRNLAQCEKNFRLKATQ